MSRVWVVAALAAGWLACSEDESEAGAGGPQVGETVEVAITAAEGGEVAITGATLTIPAGALSADTTITAEVIAKSGLPDAEAIGAAVYDFGPDGLTFNAPVPLSLDLAASLGAGERAVVAWLNEETGEWQELATTVSGGTATASIEHFTSFTVIIRADGTVDAQCDGIDTFAGCGGDITGTWTFEASCLETTETVNPIEEQCPQATAAVSIDQSGTVTFNGDGTYSVDSTQTITFEITAPKTCLPMGFTCATAAEALEFALARETADACIFSGGQSEPSMDTGTYSTNGPSITFGEPDPNETAEYCVDGNTLSLMTTETDPDTGAVTKFLYTATK